jgi:hypothetical protein
LELELNMQAFSKVITAGVLAAGLAGIGVAQAAVVFTLGNTPQQPEQENVLFSSPQTGTTINGLTNQTDTPVRITSEQSLSTGGQGQAFVAPSSDGLFTNFTFAVPGSTFTSLVFDPQVGGPPPGGGGTATVTAVSSDGTSSFSLPLTNGSNFLSILTTGGTTLSLVSFSADPGSGFNQLQQVRVGIAGSRPVTPVPEPMSLALFGAGLLGLGVVRRARRKV